MGNKRILPIIAGVVVKGLGAARHFVKGQLPGFARIFPEVKDCFPGTINVLSAQGLVLQSPDCRIPPMPEVSPFLNEFFDLWRAQVRFGLSKVWRKAWVYRSSDSIHRLNPCYLELIADPMPDPPEEGTKCEIKVEKPARPLEWLIIG